VKEREREVFLTIKKWLKVGDYNALSGHTAYTHFPFGHLARLFGHKGAETERMNQSSSRSFETARPVGRASALGRRFREPKPIS
jgi:hypothetical protein